ncbi:type I restriction-modification system subunit M [Acinetobacter soli]|uniref:class I SAM-dependent DNA methyltransferase n=1 Tax=Acinetobacter soli TaxID=487316 RepID=UPI00287D4084|nr:N-6 DNA methylase [Acinetobacter soli]MDS7695171.1 type I restriction-modification system subunit M [Acinetobacter soli]
MNLSSTIKSIQDIMRKDDGVDGDAQRLGQLTWMLFLKVFDQREEEWEKESIHYQSPLPEYLRWCNWASPKITTDGKKIPKINANEIINFVNNELFTQLKNLNADLSPTHKVIRDVFCDANNFMKSGTQLLAVIEKLEEAIHFDDFTQRAQIGDVYEQLLNDLRGAGNAGEFYTPRAITQFMVSQVNPRLNSKEVILDPACGTGGFLAATINHLSKQSTTLSTFKKMQMIANSIRGIEKKQLPHLLCTTNMLLHGIDVPSQIEHQNTLSKAWNEWDKDDKVDCIITNPPFGGYEDDSVGSDFPSEIRTRETADMFMALIIKKLLKDNGRAAVILPDGFLFGEGVKNSLKEMLLRDCKLHTIVRLPKGVFAPYTTIKTNLLFFTKNFSSEESHTTFSTDTIWFYEHPYPAGYKSYSKTRPISLEEFKPLQEWWGNEDNDFSDRVENEYAWKVDFKAKREQAELAAHPHWQQAKELNLKTKELETQVNELRNRIIDTKDEYIQKEFNAQIQNLDDQIIEINSLSAIEKIKGDSIYSRIFNLDIKNPNYQEEEVYDPYILLEEYKVLLGKIEETENKLKTELAFALSHHFNAGEN